MTTATDNKERSLRGLRTGVVISDKRDKSRTVKVDRQSRHAKYGKIIHRFSKFHVHDETNETGVGDHVEIANCRPISKTKSWRIVRVIKKAQN
jgi:small subunit ribosomal protein S17